MPISVPVDLQATPFRWEVESFRGMGMDNYSSDTTVSGDMFGSLINVMPLTDGAIRRRFGYTYLTAASTGVGIPTRFAEYLNDTTGDRKLIQTSATGVRALNEDGTIAAASLFAPSGGASAPRLAGSRSFAYFADGIGADLKKWDATTLTKWGITAPSTALSVGVPAGGAITLLSGRNYFVIFKNSTTGHCSDLNPVSPSTGPLAAKQVPLSNIEVSADTQVDVKVILATADGGDQTVLYKIAEIANAVTTYTDVTPEATLLLNNIYSEIDNFGQAHGVTFNSVPPSACQFPLKHRGRMFMINGQFLNFSKNLGECTTSTGSIVGRYEEAWPAVYQIDISTRAETPKALLSDGTTLYIGTERHIRKVEGDGPDFGVAEIAFNEAGVVNQEVWKVVFSEGQPVGTIWLTPDNRVLQSNLNDFADIGTPIQSTLNDINASAASTSSAMFVSDGEYDLYILAIPTGVSTYPNTLLVYNLRTRKWVTWELPDKVSAMCFTLRSITGAPQWMFTSATDNSTYKFTRTAVQDRTGNTPVNITSTILTNWEAFGDPTARKALNEIELITGDSTLAVVVNGASTVAEFETPSLVKSGTILTGPLGDYKFYLAGARTTDRYYQFQFTSSSQIQNILESFNVMVVPLHRN